MSSDSGIGGVGSASGLSGSDSGGGFPGGDSSSDSMGSHGIDLTNSSNDAALASFSDSGPAADEPNLGEGIMAMMMPGGADAGAAADEPAGGPAGGGGSGQDSVSNADAGGASAGGANPESQAAASTGDSQPSSSEGGGDNSASGESYEVHSYGAEFSPGGDDGQNGESGEANSGGDEPIMDPTTDPLLGDPLPPATLPLTDGSGGEVSAEAVGTTKDDPSTQGRDITFFAADSVEPGPPSLASDQPSVSPDVTPSASLADNPVKGEGKADATPSAPDNPQAPGQEQQGLAADASASAAAATSDQSTNTESAGSQPAESPAAGPGVGSGEWLSAQLDELTRDTESQATAAEIPRGSPEGSPRGTELGPGAPSGDGIMAMIHGALDALGLIPVLGVVPDAVNAGFYLIEGNWKDAGISATAMVPWVGQGATLTKRGVRISKEAAESLGEEGIQRAVRSSANRGLEKVGRSRSEGALRKAARGKAARTIREGVDRNGQHSLDFLLNRNGTDLVRRGSGKHSNLADNAFPDAVHGDSKFSGALDRLGVGDAHVNQALQGYSERQGSVFMRQFYDIEGVPVDAESARAWNSLGLLSDEAINNAGRHPGWFSGDL